MTKNTASCHLYYSYKKSAERRNITFNLSYTEFLKIAKQDCYICKTKPAQVCRRKANNKYFLYTYNGVDRVDNKRGYVVGNVEACCGRCNSVKSSQGVRELLSHLTKMIKGLKVFCEKA